MTFAQSSGRDCAGILSLKLVENGETSGYEAMEIRTGEKRILATHVPGSTIVLGDWFFDPQTLAWGNGVLASTAPCDLLVVDEIGPLELELGNGWQQAVPVLNAGQYSLALVVIRPELLEKLRNLLEKQVVLVIDAAEGETQEALSFLEKN
jgi:nucleoside-triphosphatase THEP1